MGLTDEKRYLGDGVYGEIENGMIKLTTENGIAVTNTIFLEPEVYSSLVLWIEKLTEQVAAQ